MKKLFIALISLGVCGLVLCLGQISAQETLTVTQNHFEFRDEPRVSEDTLMGTLRLGTPVEWTGKTSGKWFEVKAPNGQIGWVHETGISPPKSVVKPTPVPSTSTSREVSRPPSAQTSKLQAKIKELENESKEYKNQLEEKDLEITGLVAKLENVGEQLSDTVKMSEELKQGREEEGQKLIEAQNELTTLQETLKEKETALSTETVEVTKLQNQLQDLREQRENSLSLERLLLAISIPLNILGLILLGYIGIRHSRQKREEESLIVTEGSQQRPEGVLSSEQPFEVQTANQSDLISTEPVTVQTVVDAEPDMEELDVVMASSTSEEEFAAVGEEVSLEEELTEEEVVADVVDMGEEYGDVEEFEEVIEEVDIEPEPEEVILVGDAIESIGEEEEEISDIPVDMLEILGEEDGLPPEEESIEELLEEPEEGSIGDLLEEAEEESVDEFWDEPQEEILDELAEYDEEILDVEQEVEQLEELPGESEGIEAELDLEPEEIETEEDIEAETAEELDKHMEELLEDTPAIEQNTSLDDLLEAGELEEIETTPTEEVTQEVEIEGEKFQRLSESSTQLIEQEQDELFEEEELRYEEDREEIEEDVLIGHPGIIEELESIEETPVSREVLDEGQDVSEREIQEELKDDSEQFTSMLEEQETQVFEAEEGQGEVLENRVGEEYEEETETELVDESVDEELLEEKALEDELEELLEEEAFDDELEEELLEEDLEDELEELLKEEGIEEIERVSELDTEEMFEESIDVMTKAEETLEGVLQAAPALLEPSPFLIEPEELLDDTIDTQEQPPQEAKYDIELLGVGQSKDNVIRLLSKIEGLTGSPQELVENVPCIIARGATKADAQNFQVVMKKFGSEVRLIEK